MQECAARGKKKILQDVISLCVQWRRGRKKKFQKLLTVLLFPPLINTFLKVQRLGTRFKLPWLWLWWKAKKKKKKENYFFPLCSLHHINGPWRFTTEVGSGMLFEGNPKGGKRAVSAPSIFERDCGHLDPKEKKVLEPLRRGWIPPGAGDISLLPDYIVRAGASCLLQLWARPWQWQCSSHDSKKNCIYRG